MHGGAHAGRACAVAPLVKAESDAGQPPDFSADRANARRGQFQ